ncbi:MAG: alpha/beta hydrolase [Burkholderiaceae bacterium]|nr:alpha/beta hydrolase [Burkholderiaceae bacterium]
MRLPSLSRSWLASGLILAAGIGVVACAPTTALNALVAHDTHVLIPSIAYGSLPRQQLDVYRPTVAAPPNGYPVAVFFYGGSWNRGERADYKFVAAALASRGVLTLVADYRLYPQVRYPEFLEDCAQAVAYGLREAAALGGDPKRVFVVGHSAGAYNAAMLALDARWLRGAGHDPSELAGWVGLAGPYDFLPIVNPDVRPVFFHPDYPSGTRVFEHISAGSPRAFLGAARTDDLVDPQRNTVGLAARLKAAGGLVTLRLYDRVNHVTMAAAFAAPLRWMAPVLDDVSAFLLEP